MNTRESNKSKDTQPKYQLTTNRKAWTTEEDEILAEQIMKEGSNWRKIAKQLIDRNPSQCSQRWKRINPDKIDRNQKWTNEEDSQLLKLLEQYPNKWTYIATQFKNRSGRQIRERYINHLDPNINTKGWQKKEDRLLWKYYQIYGSKWSEISKQLPGRPENMIKNRFYSYVRAKYGNQQNPYYIVHKTEQKTTNLGTKQLKQKGDETAIEVEMNNIKEANQFTSNDIQQSPDQKLQSLGCAQYYQKQSQEFEIKMQKFDSSLFDQLQFNQNSIQNFPDPQDNFFESLFSNNVESLAMKMRSDIMPMIFRNSI